MPQKAADNLFSPLNLRGVSLRNRVVMPAMALASAADFGGFATPAHVAHYLARAQGGAGLIVVEAACVHPEGRTDERQLGLWSDTQISGMAVIADACRGAGAAVLAQLFHAGDKALPRLLGTRHPTSVSDLNLREIETLQRHFALAAVRAYHAGFCGVELNGAHGYLIGQFLSPRTNRRDDRFGGGEEGRLRFLTDIIAGIRGAIGSEFIIGCRIGVNEPDLYGSLSIARSLAEAEADIISCSHSLAFDVTPVPRNFPFNSVVYGGVQIARALPGVPVIVSNGIRTPSQARSLIADHGAPLVALGRALLSDPDWPKKAAQGLSPRICLSCKRCAWHLDGTLCPNNSR